MPKKKLTDAEKAANVAAGLTPLGKTPRGPGPGFKKDQVPSKVGQNVPDQFPEGDYRCLGTAFTEVRKNAYLKVLRETGERSLARAAVGVSRDTVQRHRSDDRTFRDAEDEARIQHAAIYSQEMKRRGLEGWQEPVFGSTGPQSGTGIVGFITKYSERLLLEQARRFEPEYTPKSRIETTVTKVDSLGLEDLSPESQADLRRILEREMAKRESNGSEPT